MQFPGGKKREKKEKASKQGTKCALKKFILNREGRRWGEAGSIW